MPLELRKVDAIVLFGWLMTVDLDAVPITHRAEKQALADLLKPTGTGRDHQRVSAGITNVSQKEIDEARDAVSRDMGW